MLTKAELDFYQHVPNLLRDLADEISSLSKEVSGLRAEVKNLKEQIAIQ